MNDLLKRLRMPCPSDEGGGPCTRCRQEFEAADEIEQLGTALNASRQCWEQLERLRSQGWCVVVKALPDNEPFVIEGSRSEYDAPCPDRRLWHGKWVCEVQWMRWGDTPETRYRCGTCMAGDTPEQAVAEACRILQEREAADRFPEFHWVGYTLTKAGVWEREEFN